MPCIDAARGRSEATSHSRCRSTSVRSDSPKAAAQRSRSGSGGAELDYPEYVAQNVAVWTRNNAKFTGPERARGLGEEMLDWGVFSVSRVGGERLRRRCRPRRPRSRWRCGYLSAWLAKRERDQSASIRRQRSWAAPKCRRSSGSSFPGGRRSARTCLPRRLVRSRRVEIRRLDLGRSLPGGSRRQRGCSGRRGARLPSQLDARPLSCIEDNVTESLQRPQRGLNRIEWEDTGEVEFHLPPGELIGLLREAASRSSG